MPMHASPRELSGEEIGEGNAGWYSSRHAEMYVDGGMAELVQMSVSLHEVIHAIVDLHGGLELRRGMSADDVEEQFIQRIQDGLLLVLRENPQYIAWLTKPKIVS